MANGARPRAPEDADAHDGNHSGPRINPYQAPRASCSDVTPPSRLWSTVSRLSLPLGALFTGVAWASTFAYLYLTYNGLNAVNLNALMREITGNLALVSCTLTLPAILAAFWRASVLRKGLALALALIISPIYYVPLCGLIGSWAR